ncbi:MAG TPA: PEP-CTERM sorting domain-containing protein [Bryobacteraceae bacterium]|jgi:hypothetical protein|nr:PEP-CTERM sorting domain-containing protein [Bryobacteraceae bacterium]
MKRYNAILAAVVGLLTIGSVRADIVLMGNDTNAAASMYTEAGTFLGHLGAFSGSTGTAFDGLGHAYVAYGASGSSAIREFDGSGNLLNTVTFNQGWAEDITYIAGTLWVSEAFTGNQYHIDLAGNNLGNFGGTFAEGITTDGTFLYTSDGFGGSGVITQRDLAGTATGLTISTGFGSNLSLGYDAANNTFWMGHYQGVGEFNFAGASVGGFSTVTDSPYYHDGVAVGNFNGSAVPEPSLLVLLLPGMAGLLFFARRKRVQQ